MTQELAIWVVRETLFTALMVASPMLITGLVVGLSISLIQSATQLQEMTLTFIPKILSVVIVLILLASWMIDKLLQFTHTLFGLISQMAR